MSSGGEWYGMAEVGRMREGMRGSARGVHWCVEGGLIPWLSLSAQDILT